MPHHPELHSLRSLLEASWRCQTHLQALQVQGHGAVKLPACEPVDRAKERQGAPVVNHPREAAKGLELRCAEVELADLHRQLTVWLLHARMLVHGPLPVDWLSSASGCQPHGNPIECLLSGMSGVAPSVLRANPNIV